MVTKGPSRPTPSRLNAVDWRSVSAERMASLYEAEIDRWGSALDWETAPDWQEVEKGRQLGTVAGVVVLDDAGGVAGWCYFLVHKRSLQVGSFVASSDA